MAERAKANNLRVCAFQTSRDVDELPPSWSEQEGTMSILSLRTAKFQPRWLGDEERSPRDRKEIAALTVTAAEAVCKAWRLMATGATGLYIYDDETDEAYWPNDFAGLFKVRVSEAAYPEAPDQETAARRQAGRLA
jgi:hypothetical protein